MDSAKVSLIKTEPEVSSFGITQDSSPKNVKNESISRNQIVKNYSKGIGTDESKITEKERITGSDEATYSQQERQRTGRYLAVGVTIIMLFIAFYHTLLRHASFLAGLLAPAIIMLLYILWLFYFAKKKKTQVSNV